MGNFFKRLYNKLFVKAPVHVPIPKEVTDPFQKTISDIHEKISLKPFPTRAEVRDYVLSLYNIDDTNNSYGKAYKYYRETEGDNRSSLIDALNTRHNVELGNPYCMTGGNDVFDCIEKNFGVIVDIPRHASTQATAGEVKEDYVIDTPNDLCGIIYKHLLHQGTGHYANGLSPVVNGRVSTFEFNTNIHDQDKIVRDGSGAGFTSRKWGGVSEMQPRVIFDIYKAIKPKEGNNNGGAARNL